MKELSMIELQDVSGGILPLVIAAGATLAGAFVGGYEVGKIIGEGLQREHEVNHIPTCSVEES